MFVHAPISEHQAAYDQIARMRDLEVALSADAAYAATTHTSKSIALPVATYEWKNWDAPKLQFVVRDNFHDVNLYVRASATMDIPLDTLYKRRDFAWYQSEIARKKGYCFKDWTTEEIEDPRILRVQRLNGNGWSTVKPEEKDRWAARMTETGWYTHDWSSGALLTVGPTPFDETTVFYHAPHAYAEGIPEHAGPYKGPCTKFILSLDSWADLIRVGAAIVEHVKSIPA